MKINEFAKQVLGINLLAYQQELLTLIEINPKGYLKEVLRKNPNFLVKQVAHVYDKYEQYVGSH